MKFLQALAFTVAVLKCSQINAQEDENSSGKMVKMCLFYPNPSGHARTDPIISQTCPSDHVHTVSEDRWNAKFLLLLYFAHIDLMI